MENKTAYPYITEFKKEPFKSFVLAKRKDIGNFYLSNYNKILELYQDYNLSLLKESSLNLEDIFWFLLLRKYIKQKADEHSEAFLEIIKGCEVEIIEKDQLGFKASPYSVKGPDIWSTYYALASLQLLGVLQQYLASKGQDIIIEKIKNFIYDHKRNNGFLHCLDKKCELCNQGPVGETFYYVVESLMLIDVDVRFFKEQFRQYLRDRKKDVSLVFKLLSLKFFDLDSDVKDKEIQYFYQFQQPNGGFIIESIGGDIESTFWCVNLLDIYSWLIDYNPAIIYSFIAEKLDSILKDKEGWNLTALRNVTKLVILLSLIWNRFIEDVERVVFKQLETYNFIDLNQIKTTFGLSHGVEEIVLYINLNYMFSLKNIDISSEFNSYLQNLSQDKKKIIQDIYDQLSNNSIISLSDIYKKYRSSYQQEPVKLKEDIFPIIYDLISNHFFEGEIRSKKAYLFKTKFYFCLDVLYKNIIVSDKEINSERLFEEKAKLKEIKNDIYNMTLKLKNTIPQIKEEIESYLMIDEVDFAKERLNFLIKTLKHRLIKSLFILTCKLL
ncbi:MAG: prenyltransferase/squalene oxidase repeat-containing protein [Promethearchaeota archaeon]